MTTQRSPEIHLKEIPSSPLTPLDIERKDVPVEGQDYAVLFEGEIVGTIVAGIALRDRTLRWQDVESAVEKDNKRKRESELPDHEKSLMLLRKCLTSTHRIQKPQYFASPFPYGFESIEELAMVGGDDFERTCRLFNHWFNVPMIDRFNREVRDFDPSKLTTDELKTAEKKLKKLWSETHGILMKRVSGR